MSQSRMDLAPSSAPGMSAIRNSPGHLKIGTIAGTPRIENGGTFAGEFADGRLARQHSPRSRRVCRGWGGRPGVGNRPCRYWSRTLSARSREASGSVKIEGADVAFPGPRIVPEIFEAMIRRRAYDVSELGMTYFLRTFDKEGHSPFLAIPVFL